MKILDVAFDETSAQLRDLYAQVPRLWSLRELSDVLAVPASTIRTWISEGVGPQFIKIRGQLRFQPLEVLAWLEANTYHPSGRKPGPATGSEHAARGVDHRSDQLSDDQSDSGCGRRS